MSKEKKQKEEPIKISTIDDLIEALGGRDFVRKTLEEIEKNKEKEKDEEDKEEE